MLQVSLDILNQLTKPQCVKPKHGPFTIARYYNLLNVKVQWLCNKSPISSFMTACFCALGSPWTSSSVDRSGKIFFLASSGLYTVFISLSTFAVITICRRYRCIFPVNAICLQNPKSAVFAAFRDCGNHESGRSARQWSYNFIYTSFSFWSGRHPGIGTRMCNSASSQYTIVHHFLSWKSDRIKITVNHPVGRHRWKATPRKFHHGSSAKWGALHGCLQLLSILHV